MNNDPYQYFERAIFNFTALTRVTGGLCPYYLTLAKTDADRFEQAILCSSATERKELIRHRRILIEIGLLHRDR